MLGLLGIPFIKSNGEAEAMCAWLNENNVSFLSQVGFNGGQCTFRCHHVHFDKSHMYW